MPGHDSLSGKQLHTPFRWIVDDQAAREALSVAVSDVDKVAVQVDDGTLWRLTGVSPTTWLQTGGGNIDAVFSATGDILYRASNASATPLAIGTEGQVLGVGSGGVPAWTTLEEPAGGMWEFVSKATADDSASLEFTGMDITSYEYRFILTNVRPSSASTLNFTVSQDGSTYVASGYYTSGDVTVTNSSSWALSGSVATDTLGVAAKLTLTQLRDSGDSCWLYGWARWGNATESSLYRNSMAISANPVSVKFAYGVGNIYIGTIEMYRRTRN